jgi:hypothetical protein
LELKNQRLFTLQFSVISFVFVFFSPEFLFPEFFFWGFLLLLFVGNLVGRRRLCTVGILVGKPQVGGEVGRVGTVVGTPQVGGLVGSVGGDTG